MNYRVRRQGEDLGVFTLEELRRRREAGELAGSEYVQHEGRSDWQPLDLVLQQGYRTTPPPLPSSVSSPSPNLYWVWGILAIGFVVCVVAGVLFVLRVRQGIQLATRQLPTRSIEEPRPEAVAAASRPIVWNTNTLTRIDANKRSREFRIRQWLDGYQKRGEHNPATDAEVEQFIQVWIARNYGGPEATNPVSLPAESDRLANNPHCTDPLALTVAANESRDNSDAISRFERALAAYPGSLHKAYPRFYATVVLSRYLGEQPERLKSLDASGLELLPKCFADGSIRPDDQQEIAEIFEDGWGDGFFRRNAASVCTIAREAGPDYQWLALTLDGEREIAAAWAARGGGYANTVTTGGWSGFNSHLAAARNDLTNAWNLQPGWPLAPARMIYVSLGDSDIEEMRLWFDRTTVAQIDYPRAWSDLRWGLRPRWYGNEEALLALGKAAVATKRFDTDVPRKFIDCVYDVESELNLPRGHHIFGRDDIWPQFQIIYPGYINADSQAKYRNGWRSSYAIIAYYAGKYDVSRAQLEAMDWKPEATILAEWRLDATVWPSEVAARSGPLGQRIWAAETKCQHGDNAGALKAFMELNAITNTDTHTKEYFRRRIAELDGKEATNSIHGTN